MVLADVEVQKVSGGEVLLARGASIGVRLGVVDLEVGEGREGECCRMWG